MLLTPELKKERWEAAYAGEIHVPKDMNRATAALFWEKRHEARTIERGKYPVFNLSMRDHDDTLSFPQLYFQCDSDYEAAMVILGSWGHWQRLCEAKWFAEKLALWQEEKAQRDIAHGRAKIKALADAGNLSACKFLASGGLSDKPKQEKPSNPKPAKNPEPAPTAEEDDFLKHGLSILEKNSEHK
ncbi:unknown [Vibrio phage VpV262]|uniref:Uncharacterized protein n=1 Tax=Vibrio phage VpV262 TaxID=2907796 RepID=Q8LT41_9CAUD|nr:hypothetical protein VpV262p63 [Vibrio phage VpV262]AAM28396.1 unknown [Vibrio phage VpV262]